MSVTPGLGAFNKDKVANKFGIQLKNKDNKQIQRTLSPSNEKIFFDQEQTNLTKTMKIINNKSSLPNQSNGFQSKTPEPLRKTFENIQKSKSTSGLASILIENERPNLFNININHHSTLINSVQSNSLSINPIKRSSLTPNDRTKSPSPSPSLSLSSSPSSIIKPSERSISPIPSPKRSSIPTKTEAEIEHQKDQPLYKRQPSKTLDKTTLIDKHKHQQELSTISNTR